MWINYVFHSADCFSFGMLFSTGGSLCFTWNLRFSTLPDVFLVSFSLHPCFHHFMFPSSCYLTEMALFSAFCLRRCFLCVVSHEALCILLSRLSYFLFILILSSFYFLFNRWSGISAFCRSCCLLALFHMKHLAFFSIWLASFVSFRILSSFISCLVLYHANCLLSFLFLVVFSFLCSILFLFSLSTCRSGE